MTSGRRPKGRPQLRYKEVCKRDIEAHDINTNSWEDLAADRMMWKSTLNQHLKTGEKKLVNAEVGRRVRRKKRDNSNRPETTHECEFCGRNCFSHIGFYRHKRRCTIEQTGQLGCIHMINIDRRRPYYCCYDDDDDDDDDDDTAAKGKTAIRCWLASFGFRMSFLWGLFYRPSLHVRVSSATLKRAAQTPSGTPDILCHPVRECLHTQAAYVHV